jgi:hypothetical protein
MEISRKALSTKGPDGTFTGDVVFAPDGEEHWHGATPDQFMTHLSITEGAARWAEHVSDTEYRGGNT